jgi:hypothetical protein
MRRVGPFLLGAMLTAACVDPCERAEALAQRYRTDHAPCFEAPLPPRQRLDRATCEASLGPCTGADLATLDAYFGCVAALPACTVATKEAWTASLLQCADGMTTVTPGCFVP